MRQEEGNLANWPLVHSSSSLHSCDTYKPIFPAVYFNNFGQRPLGWYSFKMTMSPTVIMMPFVELFSVEKYTFSRNVKQGSDTNPNIEEVMLNEEKKGQKNTERLTNQEMSWSEDFDSIIIV